MDKFTRLAAPACPLVQANLNTDQILPQLGSVALQTGETAGDNIARRLKGKETEPFTYLDKGTMATIGRGAAVAQLPGGHTMKGKMASLAWGTVHLALLTGGDSRAKTLLDWGWAGATRKRTDRISVDVVSPRFPGAPRHYQRFSDVLDEIIEARVWGGIHFRTADEQGAGIGRKVARFEARHYFRRVE